MQEEEALCFFPWESILHTSIAQQVLHCAWQNSDVILSSVKSVHVLAAFVLQLLQETFVRNFDCKSGDYSKRAGVKCE